MWPVGQFGSTLCQAMGGSVEDAQHMGGVVLDVDALLPWQRPYFISLGFILCRVG